MSITDLAKSKGAHRLYTAMLGMMTWPAATRISEIVLPVLVTIGFSRGMTSSCEATRFRWYTIQWYRSVSYHDEERQHIVYKTQTVTTP